MDQIGTLELSWAQGYNGGKASYIDKDVICYLCGNNVKFVAEDGAETVFNFPGEGVGPFAVHTLSRCFAVAEQCLDPKIYVFVYPTFREMKVLKNGAKLEYSELFFSSSDYLCSLSGIPEFELTLWNFVDGTKLTTFAISSSNVPTSMSFNPGNWRQMCLTTNSTVTMLQIEQSDEHYVMKPTRVRLPATDPDMEEEDDIGLSAPTRASTRMTRYTMEIPKAAKAGLVGDMAERLDDIQDSTERVKPVSQVWTPIGDVFVGCSGGELIKVDGETNRANVIYYPPPPIKAPGSRMSSAGIQRTSMIDLQTVTEDVTSIILEGGMDCIGIHKRGLYCAGKDGTLRLLDIKSSNVNIIEHCQIGAPLTSLAFSPTYRRIAIGSNRGTLHLYEPGVPQSLKMLRDLHHGQIVGIGCLPGSEHCLTCRDDGEVQIWTISRGLLTSSYSLDIQVVSMAVSPLLAVCAIGTVTGHILYLDLSNPESPRVVERVRVFEGPVSHLVYDGNGRYLLTASETGHVFVVDGRATQNFKPIAHTGFTGTVQSLALYTDGPTVHVVVTHNTSTNKRSGANYLTSFDITEDIMKDLRYNCNSLKYDFKDKSVKKLQVKLAVPSFGVAIGKHKTVFTLAQNNKSVHQHTLPPPEDLPYNQKDEPFSLEPQSEFPGHQLPGGRVLLSPHQKWLASFGTDGAVMLRTIGQMERTVSITPHDYRTGGVKTMAFTEDSQHIFTSGFDGVLTCYSWNYSPTGVSKARSAMDAARVKKTNMMASQTEEMEYLKALPDWSLSQASRADLDKPPQSREDIERAKREEALTRDEIYRTPTPTPAHDATWLQVQELENPHNISPEYFDLSFKEEDRQYADTKRKLRESIRDMRRTLQGMLQKNEALPEIEKLNRHEFDLDIEEQMRLQGEADQEVERVREEIEFENLAKMYLREMIKRECWDDMVVKGRAVQAFNSNLEISNFPMRERAQAAIKLLEKVTKRRKIEMTEAAGMDDPLPPPTTKSTGGKKKVRKEMLEQVQKPTPTTAQDEELGEGEDDDGKEQPSTSGSLGAQYGGGSDLFYSQFELHTREQKVSQIILLEDAIFRIKQLFNKEFDDLFVKKEQEISKINEKNKRLKKVIADLEVVEEVIEPTLGIAEKPERLLTVEDHEVTVEKYYTPEQKKALEKKEKEEEQRRARERGDNVRERALVDMMGGVLEIKKEDELKKDVPKPSFMTQKAEEEWSEDEQKIAKDYEKRCRELIEEREKYRKQLETELRKNQTVIQEGMANFDDMLNQVFMKKIKVMMVIYQEELKILRLRYSLLVEEELEIRERELNRLLDHKKNMKTLAAQTVVETRKNVEAFRELYDILIAEDKVMDKAFKREFNDVSAVMQDILYKVFRRRPRALKLPKSEGDSALPNPFADRPSTARQTAQAKQYTENAMDDLDKGSNCPEGLEPEIWQRLCLYRRQKVDNENLVKVKAQVLAEMNAFMQRRLEEDDILKSEIEGILDQINKLHEDRTRFNLNLEVQLLLKQGQVEVDAGTFIHDYKDSALLHRSVVEDLNHNIKQLGESKIASMVESKDFRKGIIQLEWEHKKMLMLMEDLQNRMKDIQFMKVTREIQLYLNSPDYEGRKIEEIGKLEQTILTQKKIHEKTIDERKKTLKDTQKVIKQRENDNEHLLKELEDLNVSVHERRHIEEVNADRRSDSGREKRYQDIVYRRKLVDLAKAQAQEVAVLRAEVERLRMRTFPALVQVEH